MKQPESQSRYSSDEVKIGEDADYLENAVNAFWADDEGLILTPEHWNRMRRAIIGVLPTVRLRAAVSEQQRTPDDVQKLHAEALDEWARLEGLCKAFADRVEQLALKMPPPNEWTPQFVQAAQYVRAEINTQSERPDSTEEKK